MGNEKTVSQGYTYVAFSRITLFENILVKDMDESKFKSFSVSGKLVIKEIQRLKQLQKGTLEK